MMASLLLNQTTTLKSRCSVSGPSSLNRLFPLFQRCSSTFRGTQLVSTSTSTHLGRSTLVVSAAAKELWSPPTVADTKSKFINGYKIPIPGIYSGIIQELLVQHHLIRYNKNYKYDEIFALGFVSVFDQVLDGLPPNAKESVFSSYLKALGESPEGFRKDASDLEAWATGLQSTEELTPKADGDKYQAIMAGVAERAQSKKFLYSKFFAIGLFRLLELTGAKDPKALEKLVTSMGLTTAAVNRDLMTYKGVLSKLTGAKDLMRETLERERRKVAEREAAKADTKSPEAADVKA